ncbi:MAG: hypothetical protein U0T69_08965 [Chitinophagales bacterium]
MKKNVLLSIIVFITISSCKIIESQIVSCAEFYVKNELSSTVKMKNYKFIDSGFYFSLDSFLFAPGQTIMVNEDCRNGSVEPFPNGAYTKLTFINNTSKTDTFSRSSTFFDNDSINIYNNKRWTFETDDVNRLKKATYVISILDSLEGR